MLNALVRHKNLADNDHHQPRINEIVSYHVPRPAVEHFTTNSTYFVSAAYSSNFCLNYYKDHFKALSICNGAISLYQKTNTEAYAGNYCDELCSVVLTSKWSTTFDRHVQVMFEFMPLFLTQNKPARPPSSVEVIGYIKLLCQSRLMRSMSAF